MLLLDIISGAFRYFGRIYVIVILIGAVYDIVDSMRKKRNAKRKKAASEETQG